MADDRDASLTVNSGGRVSYLCRAILLLFMATHHCTHHDFFHNNLYVNVRITRVDTAQQLEYQKKEEESRAAFLARIEEGQKKQEDLESIKLKKRQHFNKVKLEPGRMIKAREQGEKVLGGLMSDNSKLLGETQVIEVQTGDVTTAHKGLDGRRQTVGHQLDMLRALIQKKEAKAEDLRRLLSEENERSSRLTEACAQLDMEMNQTRMEIRHQTDSASSNGKIYEATKKRYEICRRKREGTLEMMPTIAQTFDERTKVLDALRKEEARKRASLVELKQDVEVFISNFLKQERTEETRSEELEFLERKYKEVEEGIVHASREEVTLNIEVNTLSTQRQRLQRDVVAAGAAYRDALDEVKIKENHLVDYDKSGNDCDGGSSTLPSKTRKES